MNDAHANRDNEWVSDPGQRYGQGSTEYVTGVAIRVRALAQQTSKPSTAATARGGRPAMDCGLYSRQSAGTDNNRFTEATF
jgi:hypothetical protein